MTLEITKNGNAFTLQHKPSGETILVQGKPASFENVRLAARFQALLVTNANWSLPTLQQVAASAGLRKGDLTVQITKYYYEVVGWDNCKPGGSLFVRE